MKNVIYVKCDMLVCIMSTKTFLDVGNPENMVNHNIVLEVAWHTKCKGKWVRGAQLHHKYSDPHKQTSRGQWE
jgi:hypothetical protein